MVVDPASLRTHGLGQSPLGPAMTRIAAAALRGVDPQRLVCERLIRRGDALHVDQHAVELGPGRVWAVALGKAALGMTRGLVEIVGDRLAGGIAVPKQAGRETTIGPIRVLAGDHPVPGPHSMQAGAAIVELLGRAGPGDLVVVLVSGGGSALATALPDGLSLNDLQRTTDALLKAGVPIDEINAVRSRLDLLKAGGLARLAAPARVLGLVLSDVIDGGLHTVASGPTLSRPPTVHPGAVLERVGRAKFPASVADRIASPVTLQDPLASARAITVRLGGNETAVEAAMQAARDEGFAVEQLPPLRGEARQMGVTLGQRLFALREGAAPACAIAGGETTVTVTGDGKGGRNMELALAAVPLAFGLPESTVLTLATDGEDGPTDAAGAVVRGDTLPRAVEAGLDPMQSLARNDAYPFFEALDDLVVCGSTGTNVCDLAFLFVG